MKRVNVGVVGCGNISAIYLTNLTGMFSGVVNVVAVCDLIPERALEAQKKYNIPMAKLQNFQQKEIKNFIPKRRKHLVALQGKRM